MKYLAILKDSVREAIDNKVIYVTLGLSLLLTLFVMTCKFTPLPAKEVMSAVVRGRVPGFDELMMGGKGGPRRQAPPVQAPEGPPTLGQFGVAGVEALEGPMDDPESRYRVTLVLPLRDAAAAAAVRAAPQAEIERARSKLRFGVDADFFTIVDVRLASPGNRFAAAADSLPNAVYFEATTEPTAGSRLMWGHEYALFLGGVPLGEGAPLGFVLWLAAGMVLWIGSLVTLLLSVIITAFFIPNMLRKGTVDLLLVKPVRRPALLLYKYVGGLTFILVNTTVAVVGLWLGLGLSSGVWANAFLLMIFVYTFFFAILYSVSTLFAVLTRSAVVAILMTCGVWFVLFVVGLINGFGNQLRHQEEQAGKPPEARTSGNAFFTTVRGIHFVLPRTRDLDELGGDAVMRDFMPPRVQAMVRSMQPLTISWGESITVSLAFIAVMLGLACWRFATKDY